MLAKELIDRIERRSLLDQDIVEALREQLQQSGARVTPEAVAKLLVDNGQLTGFQATKLIGELRSGEGEPTAEPDAEADLLAGFDAGDTDESDPVVVEPIPVGVEPVGGDPVAVGPVPVETVADSVPTPPRPRPVRKRSEPETSVWDSFKVYGYLGILALLLMVGGALYFILGRESADEFIAEANKQYDAQAYQAAQDLYLSFLDGYGEDNQYSSLARARIVMTELYKAAQFKREPGRAVDVAKEKLPLIADEKGMNEERRNLASLLVDIAANLASAASRADETAEKQRLLAKLDEHRELMDNPQYFSSTNRVLLAGRLKEVEESRARVTRDINRNIRLDQSESAMQESLAAKRTKQAYDVRKNLLRDFPELHDHPRLTSLISEASEIQQTLVSASSELPRSVSADAQKDQIPSIVLTTLSGKPAPDLREETLFLRAGGSVMAFRGEDGTLRWRKFVGYAKDLPPIPLDGGRGVLLSESSALEIFRCDAETGEVAWRASIGEPFSEPVSDRDDLYVATQTGRLLALSADDGEARWATQIPQPLETGPGVDRNRSLAYQTGNHSNLYVLATRGGTCDESFYLGHAEGTVAVPPVPLLGHVFVVENAGGDYANVHVLRVDDETGRNLRVAQPPFRLTGNVRVPAVIQGRRLILLTDRGEVTVLDIEQTAQGDQVTVAAKLPAYHDRPTATQMDVDKTSMWIAGTQIGRYELQINRGRVIRDWVKYELDTFIGKPRVIGDTLIHARRLRDTSAIRVIAADPKTGDEIWRTDVGVPVAMITPTTGGFHAVTSQAALFKLDRETLDSGSTAGPDEDPGRQAVGVRFSDPLRLDENRFVMVDEVSGQATLIYDPSRKREKLRLVTMQLPGGKPSGNGLIAGGGLFLALDSGRCVLVDPVTGAMTASPFQPASDPSATVRWTGPLPTPADPDQVVLADSRRRIYRVRAAAQLRELASRDLEAEMLGTAAAVDNTFVGTMGGPAADFLVGFDFDSLEPTFKTLLDGRVTWGPVAVGSLGLVQTAGGKLHGFEADGSTRFETMLPAGLPADAPVEVEGDLVLAGRDGWLLTIDSSDGKILGRVDLGQPISAAPLPIGSQLLVPGAEGVIYITPVPAGETLATAPHGEARDDVVVETVQ